MKAASLDFDLEHRWMRTMQGAIRLALLHPLRIDLDIHGSVAPKWWLWPLGLPFRPRIRRLIDKQIDEIINDLKSEAQAVRLSHLARQNDAARAPASPRPLKGVRLSVEISSLDGRRLYQHTEGSL